MPQCQKCGKESNNLRVCPFCHTEYAQAQPPKAGAPRATFGVAPQAGGANPRASMMGVPSRAGSRGIRDYIADLSPAVKWGVPGVIVTFGVWFMFFSGPRKIPVNVVMPNLVVAPMVPGQADAFMRRMRETANVDVRGSEVAVTFPATNFPLHRDGQLALAQQFARADEIIEGVKRVITFRDGAGDVFAKATPAGVMMVR